MDLFVVILPTGRVLSVAAAVFAGFFVDCIEDFPVSVASVVFFGCPVCFWETLVADVVFSGFSVDFVRTCVIVPCTDVIFASCPVGSTGNGVVFSLTNVVLSCSIGVSWVLMLFALANVGSSSCPVGVSWVRVIVLWPGVVFSSCPVGFPWAPVTFSLANVGSSSCPVDAS